MTYNLGKFVMTLRGAYSASAYYSLLDVVTFAGGSYVCKVGNVNGIIPTNTSKWMQLAAPGVATMTEEQKQDIITTILNEGVVIDPNYNTFTTEEKDKLAGLPSTVGNATLTIKRNNTTVGTFTANSTTDGAINISVPTSITELTGYNTLMFARGFEEVNDEEATIENLKPNAIYYCTKPVNDLKIMNFEYDTNVKTMCVYQPTLVVFTANTDFNITLPPDAHFKNINCSIGRYYILRVEGIYFTLDEYV